MLTRARACKALNPGRAGLWVSTGKNVGHELERKKAGMSTRARACKAWNPDRDGLWVSMGKTRRDVDSVGTTERSPRGNEPRGRAEGSRRSVAEGESRGEVDEEGRWSGSLEGESRPATPNKTLQQTKAGSGFL